MVLKLQSPRPRNRYEQISISRVCCLLLPELLVFHSCTKAADSIWNHKLNKDYRGEEGKKMKLNLNVKVNEKKNAATITIYCTKLTNKQVLDLSRPAKDTQSLALKEIMSRIVAGRYQY